MSDNGHNSKKIEIASSVTVRDLAEIIESNPEIDRVSLRFYEHLFCAISWMMFEKRCAEAISKTLHD